MVRHISSSYQRLLWELAAALVFAVFTMIVTNIYADECMGQKVTETEQTELSALAPLLTPSDDMVWRGCEIR
ncbi:MAG: hypothetical protein QNJ40_16315 [Xanthomonadales bacterium]|nr:hypothetical protein [Xanthomonadales bacterium]